MHAITTAIAALPSEQQSEWHERQRGARDPLDTLSSWTPEHRTAVCTALADYALSQADARDVLRTITTWSLRLGVALARVMALEVLRYVPASELRPLRAIETVERWTRGEATADECFSAADAAYAAYSAIDAVHAAYAAYAACAAYYATRAADAATRDADVTYTADAAYHAASANAAYTAYYANADTAAYVAADAAACDAYDTYDVARIIAVRAELRRLCVVIADSLRTGSVGEWLG